MIRQTILACALHVLVFGVIDGRAVRSSDHMVKVTRLGNCLGEHNLTFDLSDMQITQVNKTTSFINGYIDVTENITDRSLKGKVSIKRCEDVINTDRCVTFIEDLRDRDICDVLDNGFLGTNPLMRAVKPRIRCPIHIGRYHLHNAVVDNRFVTASIFKAKINYVWIRTTFFYHKRLAMCSDLWINVGATRNKNIKPKRKH